MADTNDENDPARPSPPETPSAPEAEDERSPPIAEPQRPTVGIIYEEQLSDLDPELGIDERELNLIDAVYHELAVDAANDPGPMTPEEQADVDWLIARARERMSGLPAEVRALRDRPDDRGLN